MFVVIKPPPVGEAKEPSMASGEDLLDIVDLDVKPEAEVRIKVERSRSPDMYVRLHNRRSPDSSVLDDPCVHSLCYGGRGVCRCLSTLLPRARGTAGGRIRAERRVSATWYMTAQFLQRCMVIMITVIYLLCYCCVTVEDTSSTASTQPASAQEAQPPKSKKPRVLELPSSPSPLPPGLTLDKVSAAVNSLLAPGSTTNTLTPTVITSHALVWISHAHTHTYTQQCSQSQ